MVSPNSELAQPPRTRSELLQQTPEPLTWDRKRLCALGATALGLCGAFVKPLCAFFRFAFTEERSSYLPLVPAIALYLVWIQRNEIRSRFQTSLGPSITSFALAALALASSAFVETRGNQLSLQILSLLGFFLAACFAFLGAAFVREIAFPVSFLVFAVPMPDAFAVAIEVFLQYTSAEVSYWMLALAQTPMLRDGLDFLLPGIPIRVAQECSGYNSTIALFLVGIVAGRLFLKSPWKRFALATAVVPLAILRNGLRITTIALLCVHVDPSMINSFVHRRGGPIFFVLSLVPFFSLLWFMRRSEGAATPRRKN